MEKVCPLIHAGYFANPTEDDYVTNCLKEECAWWLKGLGMCAVAALAGAIAK